MDSLLLPAARGRRTGTVQVYTFHGRYTTSAHLFAFWPDVGHIKKLKNARTCEGKAGGES